MLARVESLLEFLRKEVLDILLAPGRLGTRIRSLKTLLDHTGTTIDSAKKCKALTRSGGHQSLLFCVRRSEDYASAQNLALTGKILTH